MSDGDEETPEDGAEEETPEDEETTGGDAPSEEDASPDAADSDEDAEDEEAAREEGEADAESDEEGQGEETADEEGQGEEESEEDAEATEDLPDADTLDARLDEVGEELDAAETEADLDAAEERLDAIEADVEAADLPEPEDEDEESREEELLDRVSDLHSRLEEQRGPYAEDAVADVREAATTVSETRWTEEGVVELRGTVETALDEFAEEVDVEGRLEEGADPETMASRLEDAAGAIETADLDPDEDADAVAHVVETATALVEGVEAAESWDDLSVRQQLQAEGFYDTINEKHKDFPPEWTALKGWEQRDDAEMVLLLLDQMESEFMERHCMEALERMGNPDSMDAMVERADRRDKRAIATLGKIGVAEDAVLDTLHEYVDSDPGMAKPTMKALGEIGSEESTEAIAQRLDDDEESVRSRAARSLGLLGDTRAVEPLGDVLADDESENVRASAAWALVQIGTESALETAAEYADARSYLVESEAERAAEALDADAPTV